MQDTRTTEQKKAAMLDWVVGQIKATYLDCNIDIDNFEEILVISKFQKRDLLILKWYEAIK